MTGVSRHKDLVLGSGSPPSVKFSISSTGVTTIMNSPLVTDVKPSPVSVSVVSPSTNSVPYVSVVPQNVHHIRTRSKSGIVKPKTIMSLGTSVSDLDPTCYSQAAKFPHKQATMADEFNALMANDTWDLVPHSRRMNLVGSKWIYKTKYKLDGTVE